MPIPTPEQNGDTSSYISTVAKFKSRNKQTGTAQRRILTFFIKETPLSTYDIHKRMKPTGNWSSYKNVHKNVHKLLSMKLITKDKNFKSKHGAIKFRLSQEGMFHLFLKSIMFFREEMKGLFINYGDDRLFSEFVYPFISKDTILKINEHVFFMGLFTHIRDRCNQLNATLDYEEESRRHDTDLIQKYIPEPPIKQVAILPLPLTLINICQVLDDNDLRKLACDVFFMKSLSKRLSDFKSINDRLLNLRLKS